MWADLPAAGGCGKEGMKRGGKATYVGGPGGCQQDMLLQEAAMHGQGQVQAPKRLVQRID